MSENAFEFEMAVAEEVLGLKICRHEPRCPTQENYLGAQGCDLWLENGEFFRANGTEWDLAGVGDEIVQLMGKKDFWFSYHQDRPEPDDEDVRDYHVAAFTLQDGSYHPTHLRTRRTYGEAVADAALTAVRWRTENPSVEHVE